MPNPKSSYTPVHISARDIPPPSTISSLAQNALADGAALQRMAWPTPNDTDAWRRQVAASDTMWEQRAATILGNVAAVIETTRIAGVLCYDCVPRASPAANDAVYLYVHGGAFYVGGGAFAKVLGARAAASTDARTISVDYRMPPDHPFPTAPEDCVAVYKALIGTVDPKRIVIGGGSAGGNIAAAATLMIRDRGLPLPAGTVLLSPEVDLTESGDSFRTNEDLDVVLKGGLPECNALYANGHDLRDPYLSPLFADFTKGFPPTLIQTGTRDLFLSNSVLMHRKLRSAGIDAELHAWEGMPHAGFLLGEVQAPEDLEVDAEVARFIKRVVG